MVMAVQRQFSIQTDPMHTPAMQAEPQIVPDKRPYQHHTRTTSKQNRLEWCTQIGNHYISIPLNTLAW